MKIEVRCPFCSFQRKVESTAVPEGASWVKCPGCGEGFAFVKGNVEAEAASGSVYGDDPPAEKGPDSGVLASLGKSIRPVLASPRFFFREKALDFNKSTSFALGLLMGGAGAMVGLLWEVIAGGWPLSGIAEGRDVWSLSALLQAFLAVPLQVSIRIGLTSLIMNSCLFIVGGARRGLGATFRAVCFAQFPAAAQAFPFVGIWAAILWCGALHFIGLREIHGISYGRTILAFIFFIVLGVMVGLIAAFSELAGLLDLRGAFTGAMQ
jgi:hypothetical protein